MARRQRDKLKKKAGQIFNHIDTVQLHLAEFHEMFEGVHDQEAEALVIIGTTINLAESALEAFTKQCWAANKTTCQKYTK